MSREPSEVNVKGGRSQSLAGSRRGPARRQQLRRLAMEHLELRELLAGNTLPSTTLPSTLLTAYPQSTLASPTVPLNNPTPLPVDSFTHPDISNSGGNESAPSIAVNKNDSNKLVAVWTRDDTSISGPTHIFVEGAYSTNGGQSWTSLGTIPGGSLGLGAVELDPTTSNPIVTYAQATDASVGFDRADHFYILDSHHQASNGAGSANILVLYKYDFSGAVPVPITLDPSSRARPGTIVYESLQDNALNPVLAVDDNLTTLTDTNPKVNNGQPYTQSDPYSGNVYVAWATNDTPPQGATNFNPQRILMVGSSDGGQSFSGPVVMSQTGNPLGVSFGPQRYTTPQLTISQGRPINTAVYGPNDQGVPGGQVSVIYDDYGSLATASPPQSIISANRASGVESVTTRGSNISVNSIQAGSPSTAIIDATSGTPSIITPTLYTANVNVTNPNFSLTDMSVYLTIAHASVGDLTVRLIPPSGSGLPTFTLIQSVQTGGISGQNLGIHPTSGIVSSTVLTDYGVRRINDQASGGPYFGYYRPMQGSLDTLITNGGYRGATAAQLTGTWTLEVSDTRNGSLGSMSAWSLHMTSGMAPSSAVTVANTYVRGELAPSFPTGTTVTAKGIGPEITIASDNTLGAYSPYQGRLYVAMVDRYRDTGNPTDNTDIFMFASDDGGRTWGAPAAPGRINGFVFGFNNIDSGPHGGLRVNDDLGRRDGFSEATSDLLGDLANGRPQLQPRVAVDAATGTVITTWLDARYDAARARVTTMIAASNDGGQSSAPQVYANQSQVAIDAVTKALVNLGPIPENQSGGNPVTDGDFGFGTHQGLAVFGGKIHPAWASNLNGGTTDGTSTRRLDIRTTTATYAAGPRIISSTMGPVEPTTVSTTLGPITFNTPDPTTGGPRATGFVVTFDRPVDPLTFDINDVRIFYRDTASVVSTVAPIRVVPIITPNTDPKNPGNRYGYTDYLVEFTPSAGVGTYSYIVGPDIRDLFRNQSSMLTAQPGQTQTFATNTPLAINDVTIQSSPIAVSGFGAAQTAFNVTVNVNINHTNDANLVLTLIAPDGTRILLSNGRGFAVQGFHNTTFSDAAATPISSASTVSTSAYDNGTFQPEQPLSTLAGHSLNGTWRLEIFDTTAGDTGTLTGWSLTITPGTQVANSNSGNLMDQDADGTAGEAAVNSPFNGRLGDAYAAPEPTTKTGLNWVAGQPLPAPFTKDTLPLIVPGPHIVKTGIPDPSNPTQDLSPTPDNLVLNGTVSAIDVTFDRDMDPTTITPASILRIMGPAGQVTGLSNFTNTTFSDSAPTLISAGVAPFSGAFQPQQALSAFNGKNASGNWRLVIKDNALANVNRTGTLTSWSLAFASNPNIFIASNVPLAITPQQTITSTLSLPAFTVQGLTLTMNVNYPYDPDLEATLIGPDGTAVKLFTGVGSNGTFTVTPNPLGSDPHPSTPRTFRIGFPTQRLSGTYTVTFDSSIKAAPAPGDPAGSGLALDTNLNAGVDVLRGTPASLPVPVTFPAIDVPKPIASAQTTTATLDVDANFLVQGLTVTLNISYPNDPDLEASLIGPDGTTVRLFANVGTNGSRANFTNTTFNDAVTQTLQNDVPPFFGSYRALDLLSGFNGKAAGGRWTLVIQNDAPASANRQGSLLNWSLTFQKSQPITGLGEPVADQATASFRIFTTSPVDPLSHQTWTSIGPATETNDPPGSGYAGQIGAVAFDPSDPSFNTAYVAGSSGGVWKTTNFLTTDPLGPTYIPLTDFGPTFGMNIGSIAVFGRNNDPHQSIIIVGTGFADNAEPGIGGFGGNTRRGVGFLRSLDGGATWALLDSTNNNLPFSGNGTQPTRDHLFAQVDASGQGTSTFKVVVDPRPTVNGQVIVYAAMSGLNGGLWRSLDTGQTWLKLSNDAVHGTSATDILLDLNSATVNAISNPTGNVDTIYVGFEGPNGGVYISPNRGQTLNRMGGNDFNPLIRDPEFVPPPSIGVANGTMPTNTGRIALAKPALVPDTDPNFQVKNTIYAGWLYAAVARPDGSGLLGLFMTKDNGATWTQIHMGNLPTPAGTFGKVDRASNDPGNGIYDPLVSPGFPNSANYNIALAVDPTNPNIVYIGGTSVGQETGLLRIDVTAIYDSHAAAPFSGSQPDGGKVQLDTAGRSLIKDTQRGAPVLETIDPATGGLRITTTPYVSVSQDPNNPFATNTTLYYNNVNSLGQGGVGFTNNGGGIIWIPWDRMLNGGPDDIRPSTNVHRMITFIDPLTGHARIVVGDDQGVFTGVDNLGLLQTGIGTADSPAFSRNGNLASGQFFYGAAQPSYFGTVSAQIRALVYGNGAHTGITQSRSDVLTTGDTNWSAPTQDATNPITGNSGILNGEIDGVGVQVDQQGRNIVYQYVFPGLGGGFTDFFQVSINGGPFFSRTTGLIQTNGTSDPQWPTGSVNYVNGLTQGNFAINPINGDQVIISSNAGRIFSTTNQGQRWDVIAQPTDLDSSYAPALAFGAPDPGAPGGIGNLNNFIYAGTVNGHIFVTRTGGGSAGGGNSWTDISAGLDGSPVMKIITNPIRGNHEAYAVTQRGVYHIADSVASLSNPNPTWVNITANLFAILTAPYGNSAQSNPQLQYLTSIVADWRYVLPDNPTQANGPTHPVLYVSGEGGVFRSLDDGQSWTLFPSNAFDGAPVDGGQLPNAHVTDLNMATGKVDPTSGRAVAQPGDPNNLFASTFGRGAYSIVLAPIVFANTPTQPNNIRLDPSISAGTDSSGRPLVVPTTNRPIINGFSEQTAFGNTVTIHLYDLTAPGSTPGPLTLIGTGQTDTSGRFSVQTDADKFSTNGPKVIGIQATDQSGTVGNLATFTIVLQAIDLGQHVPPTTPTLALSPASDSSGGQLITNITTPSILGHTDPNIQVQLFLSSGGTPTGPALATATSDVNGNFILRFSSPLPDGPVTVQVVATNAFGSTTSAAPTGPTFTVDTQPPTTVPTLGIRPADDTGVKGDGITSIHTPVFAGTAEPNSIVQLFNTLNLVTPLAQTSADASGNFAIQLPSNLNNGTIQILARSRDVASNQGPASSPLTVRVVTVQGDYNGDGKADLAVFQRTNPQALWSIQGVGAFGFGSGHAHIPLQGDFNGTGVNQLAVFDPRTATWFINGNPNGIPYGGAAVRDQPVPADYNGDGKTDIAVYRPGTGQWFVAVQGEPVVVNGGAPGDVPVPGDYDNDGKADRVVYRPSTGQFLIPGQAPITVGAPNQVPVPGYYDNTATSHRMEPAVYNPVTGLMTIVGPGGAVRTVQFAAGSIVAPGDYDGTGNDEPAAFNPSTGTWTIVTPGGPRTVSFGMSNGVPLSAPFTNRKLPVAGDYAGLGAAQPAVFGRGGPSGIWQVPGVTPAGGFGFGGGGDVPLLGDFNGDGRAELAIFQPGNGRFFVRGVYPSGEVARMAGAGLISAARDIPAPADFNGDGVTDLAVFRPGTTQWIINGATGPAVTYGAPTDTPVPADYNGDGLAEIAVYRQSTATWFIRGNSAGIQFGPPGDVPVPADYNGDGRVDLATFHPSTGTWFIQNVGAFTTGPAGGIPAPADYNGDGTTDLAVYQPSTGRLTISNLLLQLSTGRFVAQSPSTVQLGGANFVPVSSPYVYRAPSSALRAASVSTSAAVGTLNFGGQAAALSASSAPVTASVSTSSATTAARGTGRGRSRPNQSIEKPSTPSTPAGRSAAARAHASALASLLAAKSGKHRH